MDKFTIDSTVIIIALVVILACYMIYKKVKQAKADDGKISKDEAFEILFCISNEVNRVLTTVRQSKDMDKTSKSEVKMFVTDNLKRAILDSDLKESEKQLLNSFGVENLAEFVMRYDNVDDAKKALAEKAKETKQVEEKK